MTEDKHYKIQACSVRTRTAEETNVLLTQFVNNSNFELSNFKISLSLNISDKLDYCKIRKQ